MSATTETSATLYEVLGVEPTATPAELKAAYRRLLKSVHPDAGGNAALFRQVQAAFECLSDPDRRALYDRTSAGGATPPPPPPPPPPTNTEPASAGMRSGGPFSEPGEPGGTPSSPAAGAPAAGEEHVPWWEAWKPWWLQGVWAPGAALEMAALAALSAPLTWQRLVRRWAADARQHGGCWRAARHVAAVSPAVWLVVLGAVAFGIGFAPAEALHNEGQSSGVMALVVGWCLLLAHRPPRFVAWRRRFAGGSTARWREVLATAATELAVACTRWTAVPLAFVGALVHALLAR